MSKLLTDIFLWFAYETGLAGKVWNYQLYAQYFFLALGLICIFFGYRMYRVLFSFSVFFTVAILACRFLSPRMDWGAVVTFFAVVGTILALFALSWVHLGGYAVCGMTGAAFGWLLFSSWWGVAAGAVIGILFMVLFPVAAIIIMTAAFGISVLAGWLPPALLAVILLPGMAVQYLLARHQKEFRRPYPAKLQDWIDNRKRAKNADSLS
jgi:hypothetical protein